MKKDQKKTVIVEQRRTFSLPKYTAPSIEVIDIEFTQSILGGSGDGSGDDMWKVPL